MNTRLERFLRNIEPVPDRLDRCADRALNSFVPPPAVITNWDQYRFALANFYAHVQSAILNIPPRAPDLQIDLCQCWTLLRKKYGESAPQAAFDVTRTGSEGGLLQLLRTIAELFSREYAEQLIGLSVEAYWSNRSATDLLSDADEYMTRYRDILPSELVEGTGARVKANFRKVLKQHPFLIQRLRQATR